ncbi:hypothetical protein RW1_035_01210 [Rhodococcus wratislaviensis NBRC 100605]|uniref:Uncharacterized protein n=1 Tax=Rhodococcus wratislaviensis NBRC 100605 TaxID=1219028 RepID=X0PUV7_RHOWR|nr:hypothetical protein RW1_035_01210 [Rhodococcus wratislaviensis NBRC 100605]
MPAVWLPISKPNPGPPTARQLGSRRGPVEKRSGRHVKTATSRVVDRRKGPARALPITAPDM